MLLEIRIGKREGSVVATSKVEFVSANKQEAWRDIRKELEDIGMTMAAFESKKEFIMNWV